MNKNNILWLDCIGGLIVGLVVLMLCHQISNWDGLPVSIIVFVGVANLTYGSFSLWVTTQKPRPLYLVSILAIANMMWLGICASIIIAHWSTLTRFGLLHKSIEGVYVGTLGYIEWRWRKSLANPKKRPRLW